MKDADLIAMKARMTAAYRSAKGAQTRAERKWTETPTADLMGFVERARGYAEGIRRSLDFVEGRLESLELPLDWQEFPSG